MTVLPAIPSRARTVGRWLWLAAAMVGAFVAACANWHDIFAANGQVFFVDADCYARMTRVRIICEHFGRVLAAHDFENYPFGTQPHTTALFDYMIWALRGGLGMFSHGEALDRAGAWISPLLALAAVAAVGVWANLARLPGRVPTLLVLAASPILAHCFSLGRPDHQSLALACMAWALAAEWAMWQHPSRGWGWVSGVAWALGLWTTLYEPVILLAVVLAAGLVFNRPALRRRERLPGLAAGGVILLAALAIEGWRIDSLPGFGEGGGAPFFAAWSRQIGELASVPPWNGALFRWTGWGLWVAPVLLLLPRRGPEAGEVGNAARLGRAQAVLVVVVWALTCWQIRWGYFLPLVYAMSVPGQLGAFPVRWRPIVAAALVAGLWPMLGEWRERLHPPPERAAASTEAREDTVLLRETADFIGRASSEPIPGHHADTRGILAPWWQCPALAYWSGQPAVAGSSHESLPGTVDTARFYLETDARAAADLLRDRQVRWIVAYEPERVLEGTAAPLLGRAVSPRCLGNVLYRRPELAPTFLRLAMVNPYFKVYEVLPASLP